MKREKILQIALAFWAVLGTGCVASAPPALPSGRGAQTFWIRYEQPLSRNTDLVVCDLFRSGCGMVALGGAFQIRSWLLGAEYRLARWHTLVEGNEFGLSIGRALDGEKHRISGFLLLNPLMRVRGGHFLGGGQVGVLWRNPKRWQSRVFAEVLYAHLNDSTGRMLRKGMQARLGLQLLLGWGKDCRWIVGGSGKWQNVAWRWGRAYRAWVPTIEGGLMCQRRRK